MNKKSFEEQLRLLNRNGVPEAGALLNKLEELASERSYSSIEALLRQFDVTEERRKERKNEKASRPMTRLQILKFWKINGLWPTPLRVMRSRSTFTVPRGNARRVREVRRLVGDYMY